MKKPEETLAKLYKLSIPTNIVKDIPALSPYLKQVLGIEIEVENVSKNMEGYAKILNPNKWVISTDNSLRGHAFEFISVPMETASIIAALKEFYGTTKFKEDNFTDRCSIHVHANVLDFTVDQLSSLALYYQTIEKVLFEFVGGNRDTNLYCIPWTQCLMNHSFITRLYEDDTYTLKHWQKYTALNLLPILRQGTVEFRHMPGTANLDKIFTWINIISYLLWKSKTSNLEEVLKEINGLNDSSHYSRYFDSLFNHALPYNEKYRQALIDGVIHAKYSLVGFNMETKGIKSKKKVVASNTPLEYGLITPPPPDLANQIDTAIDQADQRDQERPAREVVFRNNLPRYGWASVYNTEVIRANQRIDNNVIANRAADILGDRGNPRPPDAPDFLIDDEIREQAEF